MKHYVFTITYSNGVSFSKQINAFDAMTAWRKFTDWMQGTMKDISTWAHDIGLTDWAQSALNDISAQLDESGFAQWSREISAEVQTLMDHTPALQVWLKNAGEEVNRAWNILVNADQHTEKEVREALETVVKSLNS